MCCNKILMGLYTICSLFMLGGCSASEAETLQETYSKVDTLSLDDSTATEIVNQAAANVTSVLLLTGGGTLTGGTIEANDNANKDAFAGVFIKAEDCWLEIDDMGVGRRCGANINGTAIHSNAEVALYIQTIDGHVNVSNAIVNGVNGGILAEAWNPPFSYIVTLENVTVTAEGNSDSWCGNTAVAATNDAIVFIYGGSYTGDNAVFSSEGGGIVIYDGYFDGKLNGSNIRIVGGTFTDDPTTYVNLVYDEVIENDDGTYTVQEMDFVGEILLDSDGFTATVHSGDRNRVRINDEDGHSVSPDYVTLAVTDSEGNELIADKDYIWDEISESVIIYNNTAENMEVYLRATDGDVGLEAWAAVTVKPASDAVMGRSDSADRE